MLIARSDQKFDAKIVEIAPWRWLVVVGSTLILLGLFASANLFLATVAALYVVAATLAAGGILMIMHAMAMRHWNWAVFWAAAGLLYLASAGYIILHPDRSAALLTFVLIPLFAASGLARTVLALVRRDTGWVWMLLSGLASIAAAALVAWGWPANAIWVLGLILSVDLVVQGLVLAAIGFTLRPEARA